MHQIFVWTFGDVISFAVVFVVLVLFIAAGLKQLVLQLMCNHSFGVRESMACDAICKKCGKNLGFIGTWREKNHPSLSARSSADGL